MKTNLFLAAGLLIFAVGSAQTYSEPASAGNGGSNNVFLGEDAGNVTTAEKNVFTGFNAGLLNTTGQWNVFTGYRAGVSNVTGGNNVFVGMEAGRDNDNDQNVFVGASSGRGSSGYGNTFTGCVSGQINDGSYNCMYGHQAGQASTGEHNVFMGANSGFNCTGNNNVLLGYRTGMALTSGDRNVLIGYLAGSSLTTQDEQLYIDNTNTSNPLIYGDFNLNQLKFNGTVGIGTNFGTFPSLSGTPDLSDYKLFVKGGIIATEVRVRAVNTWPDYVFENDYKLLSLKETEQYIADNGHLPNMPSAKQIEEEGIEVGNMAKLQQEKIEELTLHLIEQSKKIEELQAQVQLLLNKK